MPDPATSTLDAALAAHDAGLCIVRVATDGTKKPLGTWKQYQTERPDRETVAQWFADGHPGMGVICGAVSGNLEMLELEGRFATEEGRKRFVRAMTAAGLELLTKRLVNGYYTISPSEGRHFVYRVDGAIDGNTKLARNADNETLIETRGEGGFVVLAPSHGTVHPTGKPWRVKAGTFDGIPTLTAEERQAFFEVCRSFDEGPEVKPPAPLPAHQRTTFTRATGITVTDSWMDATVDHLNTRGAKAALEDHGWTYCYTDGHGRDLLRRPGKDHGVSGSINQNGRFHPFSTSVPFKVGGIPATTFDALDIIAAYEYGGDRQTAARTIAETTGILDTWKAHRDAETVAELAAPTINTETGEIVRPSTNLPDEFWTARPELTHIRQGAHNRLVSADAVLAATLARVVFLTPPNIVLPPIVGGIVSLNLFVAIVDPSGGGKTASANVAKLLLPHNRIDVIDPILPSSGEGLIEAFFDFIDEEQPNGQTKKVKAKNKDAGIAVVDEGQALLSQADRSGSTVMETIRSAWMGGDLGQHNAAEERKRWLQPHTYRLSMIVGFQLAFAAGLIADGEGGTPQRFTFALATDPVIDPDLEWPGPIGFQSPPGSPQFVEIDFHPQLVADIRKRRLGRSNGSIIVDPLDTHADLRKMKLGAALAILDGRLDVNLEDWELAETIDETSCAVRQKAIDYNRSAMVAAERYATEKTVQREGVVEAAAIARTIDRLARNVAKKVWRDGPMTPAHAWRVVHSRDRSKVDMDDVVTLAIDRKWLTIDGDKVAPGAGRP